VSNEIADDVALHFCETRPSIQQYQCLTTRIRVASVEDQYEAEISRHLGDVG
jgi:hypothetical protein